MSLPIHTHCPFRVISSHPNAFASAWCLNSNVVTADKFALRFKVYCTSMGSAYIEVSGRNAIDKRSWNFNNQCWLIYGEILLSQPNYGNSNVANARGECNMSQQRKIAKLDAGSAHRHSLAVLALVYTKDKCVNCFIPLGTSATETS